jgi:hypothetical protein
LYLSPKSIASYECLRSAVNNNGPWAAVYAVNFDLVVFYGLDEASTEAKDEKHFSVVIIPNSVDKRSNVNRVRRGYRLYDLRRSVSEL